MAYTTNEGFGAINRYHELAKFLSKQGPVTYLSPNTRPELDVFKYVKHMAYPKLKFKPAFVPLFFIYAKTLKSLKKKHQTPSHVVIFNGTHGLALSVLKKKYKYKLIYGVRGSLYDNYDANKKFASSFLDSLLIKLRFKTATFVERLNIKRADKVLFQSEAGKQNYEIHFPKYKHKFRILPNNCNPSWVQNEPISMDMPAPKNIGFLGNIFYDKGIETLLEAFQKLHKTHSNIHLTYIGKGPHLARLQAEVKKRKLEQHVTLKGALPEGNRYMKNFDIMVVPSFNEAFPNVVLEALYRETPVIASNVGGIPHILPQSLLFEPGNSNKIHTMLHTFFSDERSRENIIKTLQETRETFMFNWEEAFYNYITTA